MNALLEFIRTPSPQLFVLFWAIGVLTGWVLGATFAARGRRTSTHYSRERVGGA